MPALPPQAEAVRRAILEEDFTGAREALDRLAAEVQRLTGTMPPGSPESQALESQLREFLGWARTAVRVSRSHLAHRFRQCRAASRYGTRPEPVTRAGLRVEG